MVFLQVCGAREPPGTRRHLFALWFELFWARVHEEVRPIRGCHHEFALRGACTNTQSPRPGGFSEGRSRVVKELVIQAARLAA